jgi:flagellar biosynthesis protein
LNKKSDNKAIKKTKKAAALKYDSEEMNAPRLVASGKGLIAERILEVAQKHNVFVHEDKDLVEALMKVDIGEEIPPELYQVVAKIIAFIYSVDASVNEKNAAPLN